jgi:hypothetical protein
MSDENTEKMVVYEQLSWCPCIPATDVVGGKTRNAGDGSFGSQDEMNCVDPKADGSLILV